MISTTELKRLYKGLSDGDPNVRLEALEKVYSHYETQIHPSRLGKASKCAALARSNGPEGERFAAWRMAIRFCEALFPDLPSNVLFDEVQKAAETQVERAAKKMQKLAEQYDPLLQILNAFELGRTIRVNNNVPNHRNVVAGALVYSTQLADELMQQMQQHGDVWLMLNELPALAKSAAVRSLPNGGYAVDAGELSRETTRLAKRIQEYIAKGSSSFEAKPMPKPQPKQPRQAKPRQAKHNLNQGDVLTKRWHGVTYVVTVLARGFEYNGKHYKSLTQIAKEITGARSISGPRFFGVK